MDQTLFISNVKHWTILYIFSFILLLCLSPDSYLAHICSFRDDSAWFFTCGKALMEGMVPYVDFADSKGLMLWIIYGIGYLLSPTTYHGVFWLSVAAYTISFHFIWLTSRIYSDEKESLVVMALMSLLIFLHVYHYEVRAEDFCMPWICLVLYYNCLAVKQIGGVQLKKYAFLTGVGMMFCLFIKWNMFFMMGGMALVIAILSFKQKSAVAIVYGILGMLAVALPFIVYFLIAGNFNDFVREYFINTFNITSSDYSSRMWIDFLDTNLHHLPSTFKTVALTAVFCGIVLFCRRSRSSYLLLLAYLPFYLFLELKAPWRYYISTAMPFFIFPIVWGIQHLSLYIRRISYRSTLIAAATIYFAGIVYNYRHIPVTFITNETSPIKKELELQQYLTRVKNPKIMYEGHDQGTGLLSRGLPGCKYWALQNSATDEMKAERREAVIDRKPDFFIKPGAESILLLEQCGYCQCFLTVVKNGHECKKALPLYVKKELLSED